MTSACGLGWIVVESLKKILLLSPFRLVEIPWRKTIRGYVFSLVLFFLLNWYFRTIYLFLYANVFICNSSRFLVVKCIILFMFDYCLIFLICAAVVSIDVFLIDLWLLMSEMIIVSLVVNSLRYVLCFIFCFHHAFGVYAGNIFSCVFNFHAFSLVVCSCVH